MSALNEGEERYKYQLFLSNPDRLLCEVFFRRGAWYRRAINEKDPSEIINDRGFPIKSREQAMIQTERYYYTRYVTRAQQCMNIAYAILGDNNT